jgi:hypothetical protein
MSPRGHLIGVLVLVSGALLGGGMQVAEPIFGLPNSVTALGAPWLVCAFAVGTLLPDHRLRAAVAGAAFLAGGTAIYYAALVYGYGRTSMPYATTMAVLWGAAAGVAGMVMATVGALWRDARGPRAAVLGAVPVAALAGEAALLMLAWGEGAIALITELVAAAGLLVLLCWRRAPLTRALATAVVLAGACALFESALRDVMRAAGWHGA